MTDITSEILPADEAEKIISEYTPAVKERESIPAALEEPYRKMQKREEEIERESSCRTEGVTDTTAISLSAPNARQQER